MTVKREKQLIRLSHTARVMQFGIPAFAICCVALMISYSIYADNLFRETITKEFQAHQKTIATQVSSAIESIILRLNRDIISLSESKHVKVACDEDCREAVQAFYNQNRDIVYAGYRMDSNGVLVYMYPYDENGLGADISQQEHVQRLFKTGSLVVSGLFQAVEGFEAIAIHVPVFKNGKMDGSVATVVQMSKLTHFLIRSVQSGSSGFAWLVDENGIVLNHPDKDSIGKFLLDTNLYDKATRERIFSIVRERRIATERLGDTLFALSPTTVGDKHWTVILSTPYEDISDPIINHWKNTLLVNIAVLMLFVIAGVSGFRVMQLAREKLYLVEKVALQEELRKNRDRLDMIIRNVPSGIYTVDQNRNISTWNRMAEKILGFTADEVIGRPCSLFSIGACGNVCGMFSTSLPEPVIGHECKYRTKDGREILVSKNVDYVYSSSGEVDGGVESFIDVTESRLAEKQRLNTIELEREVDQLRKLDEAKSNFLSIVSHELRTPLSVVLGNMSMARRGRYGDISEELATKLDVSIKRGWQLNALIANLLNLAKIESGKLGLQKTRFNMKKRIDESLLEVMDTVEKKALKITINVGPGTEEMIADEQMFHRVLVNILGNAVKFTEDKGTVNISTFCQGGMIGISVEDNGIGIPEEAIPRIFDRFYQADDSSTRKYGGTGLGLAIVKEIVEVHFGRIDVDSEEGRGTSVTILFPGDQELTPTGIKTDTNFKSHAISGRILIISVDSDFISAISELTETAGVKVLSVMNVKEAAVALDREHVNAIIIDIDGENFQDNDFTAWNMMLESAGLSLPVLAYCSQCGTGDRDAAKLVGAATVLSKPFSNKIFFDALGNTFS